MPQVVVNGPHSGNFKLADNTEQNYALKDGFHVTDTEKEALEEGKAFVSGYIFEGVAQNGKAVIHLKTASKNCKIIYGVGSDGSTDFGAYIGATITADGTLFGNYNRNLLINTESTAKTYYAPTVTDYGDPVVARTNGGSPGPAKGGNVSGDAKMLILPPNTSMLIVATNKSTTASRINIVIDWIETE